MNISLKRHPIRWTLGLFASLLGLFLLAALMATGEAATSFLSIFSTRFLGIFIEAIPFLLLGSLFSGLIEVFMPSDTLARWLPRNPILAALAGTFLGFMFPVCECGVIPVVRRLYNKGLPISVGISFLLAAPVINPIVMASTFIAFGFGPIFIGRFLVTILVAFLIGLIFAITAKPQDVLRPAQFSPLVEAKFDASSPILLPTETTPPSFFASLRNALLMAGDEFFDMGRYLVLGSLLAAAMQTLVSQDVLLALGRGPVLSVIALQALAYVLSVCSTVDAFLGLAFVGTFTGGSILAFLTFGPMVDIKSTLMFMGIFKPRIVLYLIILPLLMTMLVAIWFNLNISF